MGGADVQVNGVATGAQLKFQLWQVKEEGFLLSIFWLRVTGMWKMMIEYLKLLGLCLVLLKWLIWLLLGRTEDFGGGFGSFAHSI